jgi:hypothetical protein
MNIPVKREHDNLTTADIAGTPKQEAAEILDARPKLVQSERNREAAERPSTEGSMQRDLHRDQPDQNATAHATPLFPDNERGELQADWSRIQTAFVDEPRKAVEQADSLVASTMKRLAEGFSKERGNLEQQWDHGDNVSTEDLRLALQRYRSFFQRLLAA